MIWNLVIMICAAKCGGQLYYFTSEEECMKYAQPIANIVVEREPDSKVEWFCDLESASA